MLVFVIVFPLFWSNYEVQYDIGLLIKQVRRTWSCPIQTTLYKPEGLKFKLDGMDTKAMK